MLVRSEGNVTYVITLLRMILVHLSMIDFLTASQVLVLSIIFEKEVKNNISEKYI